MPIAPTGPVGDHVVPAGVVARMARAPLVRPVQLDHLRVPAVNLTGEELDLLERIDRGATIVVNQITKKIRSASLVAASGSQLPKYATTAPMPPMTSERTKSWRTDQIGRAHV